MSAGVPAPEPLLNDVGQPMKGRPTSRPLTVRQHDARLRAAEAVSRQRATPGLSLTQAARRANTTPATVLRYFGDSYRRENGRLKVAPSDRVPFVMTVVSVEEGPAERVIRGSRKRSLLGGHAAAINKALRGDENALLPFQGRTVAGLTLQTDLDALTRLQRRGQLDFIEIYRTTN